VLTAWTFSALIADTADQQAWGVLHLAIDSGGPSADVALRLLGTIDDAEARTVIESSLKSGNPGAAAVAGGLTRSQCATYLPLLKRLAENPSFEPKPPILQCIAKARSPEAAAVLREIADASGEPDAGAAFGLLESMGPVAVDALARELREGHSASKRETAVYSLPGSTVPGEVAAFREALRDPDAGVRLAGALRLGQLGSAAGEAVLTAAAEGKAPDARREAAAALAALGAPGAAGRLAKLLEDPNRAERIRTIWAIARIDGPRLRNFVYEKGLENEPDFRSMLAEKLLSPGEPRGMAVLASMLSDYDESVRLIAAGRLLSTSLADLAHTVVIDGLQSESGTVRALALQIASGSPSMEEALSGLVASSDPIVQEAAIAAAGELRQRDQFSRLEPYLQSRVPAVAMAAAKALLLIDAAAARPILMRGLNSDLSYVRIDCAAVLLSRRF